MEVALQAALTHRKPTLKPKGLCYNCDEPIPGIYCDADCREDHEKRERNAIGRR